jgi:hypothetical protein
MVYQNDLSPDNMLNDKETQNAEENAQDTSRADLFYDWTCFPYLFCFIVMLLDSINDRAF